MDEKKPSKFPLPEAIQLAKLAAILRPEFQAADAAGSSEGTGELRRLAALHRELAPQRTYFLSCRDAAKADSALNKDSANTINCALDRFGVIKLLHVGDSRPGGNALEFR